MLTVHQHFYFLPKDDDDKGGERVLILPECVVDGTNYLRCDPDTIDANDIETCDEIVAALCGYDDLAADDEEYCACLGLVENQKLVVQLRGAVNVQV